MTILASQEKNGPSGHFDDLSRLVQSTAAEKSASKNADGIDKNELVAGIKVRV
jgi:hypothetical protein